MKLKQLFSHIVYAQITNPVLDGAGEGEGVTIMNQILRVMLNFLLIVGVIYSMLNLIIGAYRWMSGGRDKGYLQEARERVFNAVVALVILFSVFAIMNLIGELFGINLVQLKVPTITNSDIYDDPSPDGPGH